VRFTDLEGWLRWQETLHPKAVELGLERVDAVWTRLSPGSLPCALITIAGTNGKGSCAAILEAIYRAAGFRTACYSSPHLLRYNERIRLDGREVDDASLCAAFGRVDDARRGSTLTYFEFGTLAAFDLFARYAPDVAILEVGLGGRLDAVNVLDPDVAIVTTIGRDHTAWLGESLDEIAAEKAGIFRPGRPAIVGHRSPAATLTARAEALGCGLSVLGREFDWECDGDGWRWCGQGLIRPGLPVPAMKGAFQRDNAAAVLMAISCLSPRLPVSLEHIRLGLRRARMPGRFQVISGEVTWILDVAHNAQSARALAANLQSFPCGGRLHAVLGTLKDKEPAQIAGPLARAVGVWHLGQARTPRALPTRELHAALEAVDLCPDVRLYTDIEDALDGAEAAAQAGDCVLAFGSFTTVEAALRRAHPQVGDLLI
jgi:dihydrofolate synthase/folylpolyglutamate synthase